MQREQKGGISRKKEQLVDFCIGLTIFRERNMIMLRILGCVNNRKLEIRHIKK